MSLFQPTNIYPDIKSGQGNGVIDATKKLVIQWDVNGNSQMTKYQVKILKNDTASTQMYDSGVRTDNCPYYGTSNLGVAIPFTFTLSAGTLANAGISNGHEYKILITEWWGNNDSVTLSSAAVFKTRANPTIAIANPITLTSRNYNFIFNYYQAQGDTLEWARYQIAYDTADGQANPFYDSGKIYGTADVSVYYDGFMPSIDYCIKCMVCTENGIQADTGWLSFQASYTRTELPFPITTTPLCDQSAVKVEWTGAFNIMGVGTGDYRLTNGYLEMFDNATSVTWNTVNNDPMELKTPWNIVYHGDLQGSDANLLTLVTTTGTISVDYSSGVLEVSVDGVTTRSINQVSSSDSFWIILTPTRLMIRRETPSGGALYPSDNPANDPYPNDGLVPSDGTGTTNVLLYYYNNSISQGSINSISVGGVQTCYYLLVICDTIPAEVINDIMNTTVPCPYSPAFTDETFFFASFTVGLQAGNLFVLGEELSGWAIYRQQQGSGGQTYEAVRIAQLPLSTTTFTDYGLRSDGTQYQYSIAPVMINSPGGGLVPRHDLVPLSDDSLFPKANNGADSYITGASVDSEIVQMCVWNYTLIEGAYDADAECYNVVQEFSFGKNLSTGDMSNNNSPNILQNFTQYPTVQLAPQNYKSGSLSSLIGIFTLEDGTIKYSDTRDLRDAIYELSTTTNSLFLKTRKGDLFCVRISKDISMSIMDNTREQATETSIGWVEVADATTASLMTYA